MTKDTDTPMSMDKLKVVQFKKKEEEVEGPTVQKMLEEAKGQYKELIMVGWNDDEFKIEWSDKLSPDEVYVNLSLALQRLMSSMYKF
jgi:hypothetical protein